MNAYELAYKLWQEGLPYVEKAATMLRQQADELDKVVPQLVKANGLIENLRLRIAELEKELKRTKFAWNLAENEIERLSNKDKSGNSISAEEYQKTHEGFSTIEKVIAKHEAIPSRKEAIDKAREWLKDYRVEAVFDTPQTKPLSDEEIEAVLTPFVTAQFELNKTPPKFDYLGFVRAIEERHGIK